MPSVFKRKKRRHTVNDPEESKAAIKAARKQVTKPEFELCLTQSSENLKHSKFFHDKRKHAQIHIESSEDSGSTSSAQQMNGHVNSSMSRNKSEFTSEKRHAQSSQLSASDLGRMQRRSSALSLNAEILFLRWNSEVKRAPIPSPITIPSLKSLFVCTFGMDVAIKSDPHWVVFVQDAQTEEWIPVSNAHAIPSRALVTIQHFENPPTPPPVHLNHSRNHLSNSTPQIMSRRPSSRLRRGQSGSILSRIQSSQHHDGMTSSEDMSVTSNDLDFAQRISTPEKRLIELEASILQEKLWKYPRNGAASPDDKSVAGRAETLRQTAHTIRKELQLVKAEQRSWMQHYQQMLRQTSDVIVAKLRLSRDLGTSPNTEKTNGFRRKRLDLIPLEDAYNVQSEALYEDFTLLDAMVEEMRVDVAQRRCRVVSGEVEKLAESVGSLARGLLELKRRHDPLVKDIKSVMEKELEVIIKEERFLEIEGPRLRAAVERCEHMEETLLNLRKVASMQHHRSPTIPDILPDEEPDRVQVLESIRAVIPDHQRRIDNIKLAEEAHLRKKALFKPKGPCLADQMLQDQSTKLRRTSNIADVENRRQTRVKSMYIVEKLEKEQEEKKRLEAERKIREEKEAMERYLEEQKRKDEEERKRFNEECKEFERRRLEREQMRDDLRRKEEEWQKKERERIQLGYLNEKERLEEWRRREQKRLQEERTRRQAEQHSSSRSSSENSNPVGHPPTSSGPPPYSSPMTQTRTSTQPIRSAPPPPGQTHPPPQIKTSSYHALPTNRTSNPLTARPGQHTAHSNPAISQTHPVAPPSHPTPHKIHHTRSHSSDARAKERVSEGPTTQPERSKSSYQPPPANSYSWLPRERKSKSTVGTGSYYMEHQVDPRKEVRRHPSNPGQVKPRPQKRDRNDPRRLSLGEKELKQHQENGGNLAKGTATRMAQSTDISRLPMTAVNSGQSMSTNASSVKSNGKLLPNDSNLCSSFV